MFVGIFVYCELKLFVDLVSLWVGIVFVVFFVMILLFKVEMIVSVV